MPSGLSQSHQEIAGQFQRELLQLICLGSGGQHVQRPPPRGMGRPIGLQCPCNSFTRQEVRGASDSTNQRIENNALVSNSGITAPHPLPRPPGGTEARRHQEPILLTPACSAAMVGGTRGCIRATSSGQSLLRCSAASPRRSTRLIDPTERRQSPPLPGTGDLRGSPAGRCELPRDDDLMSAVGSGAACSGCR